MGWNYILYCLLMYLMASPIGANNDSVENDESVSVNLQQLDNNLSNNNNSTERRQNGKSGKYQHLNKEIKDLRKQVSDMSKSLKAIQKDKVALEDKLQLLEFKTAKKIKKARTKIDNISSRLDMCKCPGQQQVPDMVNQNHQNQQQLPAYNNNNNHNLVPNGHGYNTMQPANTNINYGTSSGVVNMYEHDNVDEDETDDDEYMRLHEEMERKKKERKRKKKEERKRRKKEDKKSRRYNKNKSYNNKNGSGNSNTKSWMVQGSNHIFVTSGSSNTTEILDINSPRSPCPQFAEYPISVKGAVGTFIDGKPLVCGGRSSVEDYYSSCYSYHVTNDSWVEIESMMERRFQATAVMIDADRWWITGGFSGTKVYNTTEMYQPGKGFSEGPSLPTVTFQHCLVKINATHIFNVGGFPYSHDVWLLDLTTSKWTSMKPISVSRDAPHCAMTERRNGKVEVVVAGGSLPGAEKTTQIFSVTDNRWRQGPKLPRAVIYGVSVSYRNSLLILGGREMAGDLEELDLVFEYDALKETWSQLPSRLDVDRTSFVAILLPDYLHCANNFKPPERKDRRHYYRRGEDGTFQRVDQYGRVILDPHNADIDRHRSYIQQHNEQQQQQNMQQQYGSSSSTSSSSLNQFNFFN